MSRRRLYRAIVFDVGGTLLNIARDPNQIALEAVAHLGTVSLGAYLAGVRQAVEEWRAAGGRPETEDLPITWISHNRRALAIAGFEGDIAAAAQIMEETFLTSGWELYPDVPETLAVLRDAGYRLGVVSNWPATLDQTLRQVGIRHHFAVVVASGTVGYAKPHPRVFQVAAERLGVPPAGALYVGDNVEHDVIGSRAAGMDAVLLDRLGRYQSPTPRVPALSHLPQLLGVDSEVNGPSDR